MRDIYRYDVAELAEAEQGLARLKSDFENASRIREEHDAALGYGDLRGAVGDFVDNWKHNRERQLQTLESAQEALAGITENYVAFDAQAVDALNDLSQG